MTTHTAAVGIVNSFFPLIAVFLVNGRNVLSDREKISFISKMDWRLANQKARFITDRMPENIDSMRINTFYIACTELSIELIYDLTVYTDLHKIHPDQLYSL